MKILLQVIFKEVIFFKARGFQPILSPFIGKLAWRGFKSVLWLRHPKTLGQGRGNGPKEREAGWCSVKTYWFSVSTVTPVLGGTGVKTKKGIPFHPSKHLVSFQISKGLGEKYGIADSSAGQSGI